MTLPDEELDTQLNDVPNEAVELDDEPIKGEEMEKLSDIEEQRPRERDAASLQQMMTAGSFVLFSFLLLSEGVLRAATYGVPNDEPGQFNQKLLLSAAVVEIVFSVIGLMVGGAFLFFNTGNKGVTIGMLAVTFVLGGFTYVVYVWALPIWEMVNEDRAFVFDPRQFNSFRAMGFLGGLSWYTALMLGQFGLGVLLLHYQTRGKSMGLRSAQMRHFVWTINLFLTGVWFVVAGSLARANIGPGPYIELIGFVPVVIVYPWMTIVGGIVQILVGLAGIAVGAVKKGLRPYTGLLAFSWAVSVCLFVWGQTFLVEAQGLSTALTLLTVALYWITAHATSDLHYEVKEAL